jgi:hypothetical protein
MLFDKLGKDFLPDEFISGVKKGLFSPGLICISPFNVLTLLLILLSLVITFLFIWLDCLDIDFRFLYKPFIEKTSFNDKNFISSIINKHQRKCEYKLEKKRLITFSFKNINRRLFGKKIKSNFNVMFDYIDFKPN